MVVKPCQTVPHGSASLRGSVGSGSALRTLRTRSVSSRNPGALRTVARCYGRRSEAFDDQDEAWWNELAPKETDTEEPPARSEVLPLGTTYKVWGMSGALRVPHGQYRYSLQDWRSFRARLVALEQSNASLFAEDCSSCELLDSDDDSGCGFPSPLLPNPTPSSPLAPGSSYPPASSSASSSCSTATRPPPATNTKSPCRTLPTAPKQSASQPCSSQSPASNTCNGSRTRNTTNASAPQASSSTAVPPPSGKIVSRQPGSGPKPAQFKPPQKHFKRNQQQQQQDSSKLNAQRPSQASHHQQQPTKPKPADSSAGSGPRGRVSAPLLSPGPASWAHLLSHVEPGCLLLSRGGPEMSYFDRTVILITSHDDVRGSAGRVLNKPSPMKVSELQLATACPGFTEAFGPQRLQIGGPVHMNHVTVLHRYMGLSGAKEISDKLYTGGLPDAVRLVQAGLAQPQDFHMMLGVSGWAPRQLASEMSRGMWYCVSASPDLVLPRRAPSSNLLDAAALSRESHDMWARILTMVAGPDAVPRWK